MGATWLGHNGLISTPNLQEGYLQTAAWIETRSEGKFLTKELPCFDAPNDVNTILLSLLKQVYHS